VQSDLSTVSSDEVQLGIEVSSNAGYGKCFNDLRFCMGAAIGLVDFHFFRAVAFGLYLKLTHQPLLPIPVSTIIHLSHWI